MSTGCTLITPLLLLQQLPYPFIVVVVVVVVVVLSPLSLYCHRQVRMIVKWV
jgi:hypothetical protein